MTNRAERSQKSRFIGDPVEDKATLTAIACVTCAHWPGSFITTTCDAFPKGIPSEILAGINRHTESVLGDSGGIYQKLTLH